MKKKMEYSFPEKEAARSSAQAFIRQCRQLYHCFIFLLTIVNIVEPKLKIKILQEYERALCDAWEQAPMASSPNRNHVINEFRTDGKNDASHTALLGSCPG